MSDALSQKFSALADPTRRAILTRLMIGSATVSEIAEPFLERMSLPAVTKHVQVLERAGLVTKTQEAQRRVCEVNPEGFQETVDYLEQYRQQMEQSLERLDSFLRTVTDTAASKKQTSSRNKKKGKQADGRQSKSE